MPPPASVLKGGHLFVLSDKASATARFRADDTARRAELAFAASFHSGVDLQLMEDEKLPLSARALPAALADFLADKPRTREMLYELNGSDPTLADLYLRAIVEEVPVTMLGEVLQPDMARKLRHLEWFREWEAEVKAEGWAEAKAEADAAATSRHLNEFLVLRGDAPSKHALHTISTCQDADVLEAWLKRAYLGETSAQLFPEP